MTVLTPELLLQAYAIGVFPMAESRNDPAVYFVDPDQRGVLPLDGMHIPHSLRRAVRRRRFEVRLDTAFEAVLDGCAETRVNRPDTWINLEIRRLYSELHLAGYAHSVECWQHETLVGGLYGVALGGAFFGESMFSRATDASKVALVHLVARLRHGGFALLDTQFVTPHLRRFGAMEIPRARYRQLLAHAIGQAATLPLEADPGDRIVLDYLQSMSQTS
ncbi:MAG: leucyl/phenylalanyl-tRNA--protein transferase [Alphaproteobacteria bacterium]|nr:leucyl/phenylalanyl-tRNA--protein transferase [Alphaproteobacteria bacterium]